MGLFSWLTGGGDTADKVIGTVSDGIDMLVFTDEEKSIAGQKVLDFRIKWMSATSGQNLARRMIAIGVVGLFVVATALMILVWPWFPDFAKFIFKVMSDVVLIPFSTIIFFYFGGQAIKKFKE